MHSARRTWRRWRRLRPAFPLPRRFSSEPSRTPRLWTLFHDDAVARYVWRTANMCQSMLSTSNTLEDRRAVYRHIAELNDVLAARCALYANCRFDGNAVFDYYFSADEISKLDYFHPDLDGQGA